MILLEVGNLSGLVFIILLFMFGPPIFFAILGFILKRKNPNISKVFFIISVTYLVIGLGVCGSLL
jgi:hypothetical protein